MMVKSSKPDEDKVESTFEELSDFAESLNPASDEPGEDITVYDEDGTAINAEELNDDVFDLDAFDALEIEDEHKHDEPLPAVPAQSVPAGKIDEIAASVDSLNSFGVKPKKEEKRDQLTDHLFAADVEEGIFSAETDTLPQHLLDEILDIDRDFVLKAVVGFGSIDVGTFYDYIAREKDKFEGVDAQQTPAKPAQEATPPPAPLKPVKEEVKANLDAANDLAQIGLEFVDASEIGEEEYKRRFYKKKSIRNQDLTAVAGRDLKYDSSGSGKEIFIDIEALLQGKNPVVSGDEYTINAPKAQPEKTPFEQKALPKQDQKVILPDNFMLTPVDLDEAERIATEDILILSEDDLIEELEMSDLEPVLEPAVVKSVSEKKSVRGFTPSVEYFLHSPENFDTTSKAAIEEDITRQQAIVIEESADDIRHKLNNYSSVPNGLQDITERVVIIDDANDIDRFLENIDEDKREDVRKLLTYLDGLFEKLPEEVIRRFAHSEYFDLYMKVMKELGAENGFTGKS